MDRKDAKDFINQLAKKRQNWIDANRENDFEEGMQRWLAQQYPDNAHFIYELLQNAEDAHATHIYFRLEDNRFITEHDGCPFTKENVKGITGIGNTTKSDQPNAIGKFGIGFKAVFQYTNTPEVYSYPFSFKISDLVLPECLDSEDTSSKSVTRFVFPFDNPQKEPDQAFDEIAEGLLELSVTTLLFLQNIKRISWHIEPDIDDYIERENSSTYLIDIRRQGKDDFTRWLLFEKKSREKPDKSIAVAFCYDDHHASESSNDLETTLKKGPRIRPVEPGKLCIFFPAAKETTGLRFHIHAPFASTPDRASINHKDQGNESLRDQLADLFVESLAIIRDAGLLNTQFLGVLPNNKDHLDPFFRPFLSNVLEAFKKHAYTPKASGGHAPAKDLYQASKDLREMFDDEDLKFLFEDDDKAWATGVKRNSAPFYFLESIQVAEKNSLSIMSDVAKKFRFPVEEKSTSWLQSKPSDWCAKFYLMLEDYYDKYSNCPAILRTDEGSLHKPDSIFILPEDESLDNDISINLDIYPTLDKKILAGNKEHVLKLRNLLVKMGVKILGEKQVIENILLTFYSVNANKTPTIKSNQQHIVRFINYWEDNDDIELFKRHAFLLAQDKTWNYPQKIYLDAPIKNTGLNVLFQESQYKPLLDSYVNMPSQFIEFIENLGCIAHLEPNSRSASRNVDILAQLESETKKQYKSKHITDDDFGLPKYLDGLPDYCFIKNGKRKYIYNSGIFKNLPTVGNPEKIFSIQKMRLLWLMMAGLEKNKFCAVYQPNKTSKIYKAPSHLVLYLRSFNWIPGKDGRYYFPQDMTRNMLRDDFPYDNSNGWLDEIQFGIRVQKEQQEETIKEKHAQEFLKEKGLDTNETERFASIPPDDRKKILDQYECKQFRSQLPTPEVKNPQRRLKKAIEKHLQNPVRANEQLQRSIRTSKISLIDRQEYLKNIYYAEEDTNSIYCQLCQHDLDEVSFLKPDGELYFCTVEIFQSGYVHKEDKALYLLLCPLCAAKYRELVKRDQEQQSYLLNWVLEKDISQLSKNENIFPINLLGKDYSLRFNGNHLVDIKGALVSEHDQVEMNIIDDNWQDIIDDDIDIEE